jgi:hypothetical protein
MTRRTEESEFSEAKWLVKLGDIWCHYMHTSSMWPIHGHYQCGECGRRFLVPWEEDRVVQAQPRPLGFGHALATVRK